MTFQKHLSQAYALSPVSPRPAAQEMFTVQAIRPDLMAQAPVTVNASNANTRTAAATRAVGLGRKRASKAKARDR